jgi:cytochrome c oxidase assembly factor CtaG/putative copper export protein
MSTDARVSARDVSRGNSRLPAGVLTLISTCLVALAIVVSASALVVSGGAYEPALVGLPDPGPVVGWGVPILRVLTLVAGIVTIGLLLFAGVLGPAGKKGVLSRVGRTDMTRASMAALVWAILAIMQMIWTLALVLAISIPETMNPSVLTTYANELPTTRALLVMAILAMLVGIASAVASTTGTALTWLIVSIVAISLPALAGHSSGLGDHALATTSGVAHSAAAALWIGGVVALGWHATRADLPMSRAIERFSPFALIAIIVLAASGIANAYVRLDTVGQLFSTSYGQLLIAKVLIIAALAFIGWYLRARVIASKASRGIAFARVAAIELVMMAGAIGLGVALATSPYPREEVLLPTYGESLLGFAYPDAPTASGVIFGFRFEPFFFTMSLIAAGLYIVGVLKMRKHGHPWPVLRTVSWLAGIALVIWCTNAGIATYSQVSVSLHMVQHMTLTMLAPIFLVMGAPATLALRTLPTSKGHERGPREWLVWFLNSWITKIATNPFFVFFIYVIGLYGLYLTPAFGWLMGSHVGHIIMQLHFVLAGYLFYWVLIGIDPRPHPLPYWGRLVMLLLALGVHGFFAIILMMSSVPLAPEWYSIVRPEWVTDPLQDSLYGGQVAWGLSEIPTLIVLIAIAVQWARSDERDAKRLDRQADRDGDIELAAYNDRLANMGRRDQQS